jgi:NTE family protein
MLPGGAAEVGGSLVEEGAHLGCTRRLVAVGPDFSDTQAPANMMDPNLAIQAFQIGKRQAEREAAAIQAAWNF